MDFQLTLTILKRAETYFLYQQIVTRMPDRSFHTYTFADLGRRSRQLAVARRSRPSAATASTPCWNHYQHLEAYLGIPCGGFVPHTLNLRLHPNDLAYIATHAGDKAVIVDKSLLPLWSSSPTGPRSSTAFVVEDYEESCSSAPIRTTTRIQLDEDAAAAIATSGTTGMPKGVPLLAPLDRPAGRGARGAARTARDREGDLPPGRADVPRERLGLPLHVPHGRGEDRLPGPVPRPGDVARGLRDPGRDHHVRRADDLDGDPRHARRRAGPLGSLEAALDARRRPGRAARYDRGAPAATREDGRARLGHDRDSPLATASDYVGELRRRRRGGALDVVAT